MESCCGFDTSYPNKTSVRALDLFWRRHSMITQSRTSVPAPRSAIPRLLIISAQYCWPIFLLFFPPPDFVGFCQEFHMELAAFLSEHRRPELAGSPCWHLPSSAELLHSTWNPIMEQDPAGIPQHLHRESAPGFWSCSDIVLNPPSLDSEAKTF